MLDMITSFAAVCALSDYTRYVFYDVENTFKLETFRVLGRSWKCFLSREVLEADWSIWLRPMFIEKEHCSFLMNVKILGEEQSLTIT